MSNPPPIHFVISAPRSGSTWLTTALNGHPDIFATEQRLFGEFAEIWNNNDGSTAPRLTFDSYAKAFAVHYFHDNLGLNRVEFIDEFQRSFVDFLVEFATKRSEAKFIIDKVTPYPGTANFVVNQIRKLFPQSKIIQLVRDGRDVVTSATFDWLLKDAHGTDRYRYFVESDPTVKLTRFFDDEVLTKWVENWRETIEVFESAPADLRVTYEAMKVDQAVELQSVFSLLDVDADPGLARSCAQSATFEKMSEGSSKPNSPTAKVRKGIVGDWRSHFTQQDANLFASLTGDLLTELRYEPNGDWVEQCPASIVSKVNQFVNKDG